MSDLSFTEQVQLLVLDKVLLGGIVGIAIFLGNWLLERHKAKQSLRAESSKLKVGPTATLITSFYSISSEASDLLITLNDEWYKLAKELFPPKQFEL